MAASHRHAEAVTTMAAAGETNGAIASALGLSRSVVIGLRHRLGVPSGKRVPASIAGAARAPSIPKAATQPLPLVLLAAFVAPAGTAAVLFAALTRGGCKWPYGEGDAMLFCGAPALTTAQGTARPYCACHAARAFTRPRSRVAVVDKGWRR